MSEQFEGADRKTLLRVIATLYAGVARRITAFEDGLESVGVTVEFPDKGSPYEPFDDMIVELYGLDVDVDQESQIGVERLALRDTDWFGNVVWAMAREGEISVDEAHDEFMQMRAWADEARASTPE